MIRYTLRQLEYLVVCADAGSVVDAARRLNVTQPSISAAISKLEADLGVQLLIRHHAKGVVPTPSAAPLLQAARSLLLQAEEFQQSAAAATNETTGTLHIGSFIPLAPMYLPALYAELRRVHPRIELNVQDGSQDQLVDGLQQGRFHAALLYDLDLPDDIVVTELASLAPKVLLPQDHKLARKRKVSLADLADEQLVLLDVAPSRDYFTGLLKSAGLTPKIAFRSPSLELVRSMVGRGLGYSLLVTRPPGDKTYDGQQLAVREIKEKIRPSSIVLGRLAALRPTMALNAFEEVAVSYFESRAAAAGP